jgi:His/Glu/Gln/Arg/opine family amino acid ABC transporter permease subunit
MTGFFLENWHLYLAGLATALLISVLAYGLAVVIGTFGALARTSASKPLRLLSATYVAVFRSMPPLLTLYLVYFALPSFAVSVGSDVLIALTEPLGNRIIAAVAAFTLTSGAYATEIIRAGIASVSHDQIEAARSIGMTSGQTFRRVVGPQAFRVAFPTLSNEYLIALKATSLASVIGVVEVMRAAQILASASFQHLLAYSIAGLFYIAFASVLQLALQRLEGSLPGTVSRH